MNRKKTHLAVNLIANDLDARTYSRELRRALAAHAARMQAEWGTCPTIEVEVETCLLVRTHFNIKGFAHKAGRVYVRADHAAGYRSPKKIASGIVAELSFHRDTCRDCGEGLVPLPLRRRCLWSLLGLEPPAHVGRHYYFQDPQDRKYYGSYASERRPTADVVRRLILRPADAVERALHPRIAADVDQLIRRYCQQHELSLSLGPVCPLPGARAGTLAS